jgi:DNA repair exonuclease SbcCD ATPase subunit
MSAPEAPPAAFNLPLKGQFTGADARADRLIKQIRGEVEGLRQTLEQLSIESSELLEIDIAAALADPETAATLPPPALVRALVSEAERADDLADKLAAERDRTRRLRARVRKLRLEQATNNAKLDTLSEVIAALHGNIEDLRGQREFSRRLDGASRPALDEGLTLPPFAGRD